MIYSEDNLQNSCARYLDHLPGVLWCHVANERKTSPQAGARLKAKGVKSGVPDILIFNPVGGYCGLAVELKVGANKTTKAQKQWLQSLKERGWMVHVCFNLDEFIDVVDNYLGQPKR